MTMTIAEVENYLNSFPAGYKFDPSDDELITEYLQPKIDGDKELPLNLMHDVNIYEHNPDYLAEMYSPQGNKGWYFFTSRDKKYRNGTRPNRKAGDGYWKATGADKAIQRDGIEIGARKALVFYKGRPPKGEKTLWIMHEFRVAGPSQVKKRKHSSIDDGNEKSMRLDDHILCRIYKKNELSPKDKPHIEQEAAENESSESLVDEAIDQGESSSKESPVSDDSNRGGNMYNTLNNVYTVGDNNGIPNVNTYGASNNHDNHNVKLYNPRSDNKGCPNVNKYNNTSINPTDIHNVNIHNVNVYPTSYNYGDYPSVQPLIGSISTNQLMANTSTSYAGLFDWDPYQAHGNYIFSEDLNADYNNDFERSILDLLVDPQNPTIVDPDPNPMGIISACHETVNMSNPPQHSTEEIEVKDVVPLPPCPLHTPLRSLPC
ncbi:uncharacterized protein LOC141609289 [Silene latifolia]|uniref:uncharacterized protein LOC141609289 n=1 Tax=Silene latifolia TaxID=37657 RepID=UPI003D77ADD3